MHFPAFSIKLPSSTFISALHSGNSTLWRTVMNVKILLLGFALVCSALLASNGAFAQQCEAELISGRDRTIIDIISGASCNEVSRRCNKRLRRLRNQDPYFYRDAYCNIVDSPRRVDPRNSRDPRNRRNSRNPRDPRFSHSAQPQPQAYVTRAYDRCQAPGIVRCTQEWSDGRVVTEDHRCAGCRGYSNPSGDPCGWRCSFPQK